MATYVSALRNDLDFGAKLKRGVRDNPWGWYAGAGIVGLLLSRIPSKRRKKVVIKGPQMHSDVPKEAGKAAILVTVLKFALDFAKPTLMRWLRDRYLGSGRSPRTPGV